MKSCPIILNQTLRQDLVKGREMDGHMPQIISALKKAKFLMNFGHTR